MKSKAFELRDETDKWFANFDGDFGGRNREQVALP